VIKDSENVIRFSAP